MKFTINVCLIKCSERITKESEIDHQKQDLRKLFEELQDIPLSVTFAIKFAVL